MRVRRVREKVGRHRLRRVMLPRGYVLAGGRSRRFGSEKARAVLRGRPLILHAADLLATICGDVTVVTAVDRGFEDLDLRTIFDEVEDRGPLGGLHAALADAGSGLVAVTACDFVGGDPTWFETLMGAWRNEIGTRGHGGARGKPAGAVAFRDEQRWHPLCAVYSTELLDEVRRRLEAGVLSMQALLDEVGVAVTVPAGFERAKSIDTREALADYRDHE